MDFDEYDYLDKMVENPGSPKSNERNNNDKETGRSENKERRQSSKRRNEDNDDDVRLKHSKSADKSRDRDGHRVSSRRLSSPKDGENRDRDRHKSGRELRNRDRDKSRDERNGKDRDQDKDRDKDRDRDRALDKERDQRRERREHGPDYGRVRDREKESDRPHRSGSRSERFKDEHEMEKTRERERSRDKPHKEIEKDTEIREPDRGNRRHKEKKEEVTEPVADPERDQRTVFAYQISLKADERDVYEFFSKAGKVRDVRLIMDRSSRRSKGVGYIEFYDVISVPMAIALSGQTLLGHPVMVKPSEAEKNLVQSTTSTGISGGLSGPYTGGARRIYVGNLHLSIKEDQLRLVFEAFGTVELVQLPTDPVTGLCKGFGFIQFARLEDARAALSLDGQLEIAGRAIKVSAITDQAGMQEIGINTGDFDDDEGGSMSLNASSRALLMQKLDRSGTAMSFASSVGTSAGLAPSTAPAVSTILSSLPAAALAVPPVTVPSVDIIGIPSECLQLKNMFDPSLEEEPDFDLDIKDDVTEECSKYGVLKHLYVEKNSLGFVYLRFENTQSAIAAQRALHGRWFAGKMITATFMMPQAYEAKFPDSR